MKIWVMMFAVALAGIIIFGVQRGATLQSKESPFDENRAFEDLKTIVGYGPRPAASEGISKTRAYILSELQKAGLKPQLDEFEARTPRGMRKMVNIRVVRPSSVPTIIALAGHYDTKIFDFPFVGANDGGSSAAWLLEMARATAGLKLSNTLEFVFFDGEEAVLDWTDDDSVYGSRFDVDRRYKAGDLRQLKALVLVDMIGDKKLNIRRETASTAWLTNILWDTAHNLGYSQEFVDESLEVSDDHVPYLLAGIPAVDLIDFDYPAWHTAGDTLDKLSARSLKIVGDVVYLSLPEIDKR
jgi:Zn-dependent M28 family amino/carboxypeptidase